MPALHVSAHTQPGRAPPHETLTVLGDPPTTLTLTWAATPLLRVELDHTALAFTAIAHPEVWHYHRWADATIKPLPPQPDLIPLYPGDSYLALSPGARALTDRYAIARFLHERDYFNAEKLAQAVLAQMLAETEASTLAYDFSIVVIEAR